MYCIYPGCKTIASFNYKGSNSRIYCATHKLPDMENVRYKYCVCCSRKRKQDSGFCQYHHRKNIVQEDVEFGNILWSIKNY